MEKFLEGLLQCQTHQGWGLLKEASQNSYESRSWCLLQTLFYDVENLGVLFVVQFVHVMWLRGKWVPALFEAHITGSCSVHLELGK